MRHWGRHFRCGHHYGPVAIYFWRMQGWHGCVNHSRHWWRLFA